MKSEERIAVLSVANLPPVAVSIEDAAQLLSLGESMVRQLTHRSDFPSFKVGNRTLISYDRLREWAREQPDLQWGARGGLAQ